ncbi:hypothetical protein [Aureimonas sp. SK2]|uniref:hypothetical protein n=1 Tax=Aureimonas sp. SK2 TaxID=3015992 RepID=UPI002444D959|nr:hypothetical protein [Aureimonas sp. SK2]
MTITNTAELRKAIAEGFDYGSVDGNTRLAILREFYDVTYDVTDEEFEATYRDVLKQQEHYIAVAVHVGSGNVFAVRAIQNNDFTTEDMLSIQKAIGWDVGEEVDLYRILVGEDRSAAEYEIWFMPDGDYSAYDGEHVREFGQFYAYYRNRALRQAA